MLAGTVDIEGPVVVNRRGVTRIHRGHPWVFRSDVARTRDAEPGSIVRVETWDGRRHEGVLLMAGGDTLQLSDRSGRGTAVDTIAMENVRGVWRRTSLESYASDSPDWETVLDVDVIVNAANASLLGGGGADHDPTEIADDRVLEGRLAVSCNVSQLADMIELIRETTRKPVGFKTVVGAYGWLDGLCGR